MNIRHLITATTLALIGTSAFADAVERHVPPVGKFTRAEVKADLARAQASGELASLQSRYGDFGSVAASSALTMPRSRADVRTEAVAAATQRTYDSQRAGS